MASSSPRIPHHVAIVMDGNGRWATRRFLPRVAGHKQGVESLRRCVKACADRGVGVLTVFAFSSENWSRPVEEVSGLMELMVGALAREVPRLSQDGVRLHFVGERAGLSPKMVTGLVEAEAATAHNSRMVLNVCFNYGGRWDIAQAAARLAAQGEPITELSLDRAMALAHVADPDLFIRTGGEQRLSNFLLWQSAYAELFFSDKLWPEFDEAALDEAIAAFQGRERRFGQTSAQVAAPKGRQPEGDDTPRMLKQRILTAIVLLAILLPALFYRNHIAFACVMLVLIGAAAWEWGRLNGYGPRMSLFLGAETVLLCALSWWLGLLDQSLALMWTLASAAWVLGGAVLLRVAVPGWPRIPRGLRLVGGLLALWVAWLAAVQARMVGINFLLSILVLVWVADVFAYFAGRAFGLKFTRNKLAPAISPGKSWEGVWGGMIGVVVLAFAWVWADKATGATVASLYTRLHERGWWLLLLGALFLSAMSVVGDLVESLIKRSAGAKDSSRLLPGHGGVLDRVDALLPALPIAMMLAFL